MRCDGDQVVVVSNEGRFTLSRTAAASLSDELEEALSQRQEFLHTACHHRPDGRYVVSRRGANSDGHRKVFDSRQALDRLVKRLPEEVTAEDLTRSGLTDGRRHLVLRHVVEHPRWNYELVARQPLTARAVAGDEGRETERDP